MALAQYFDNLKQSFKKKRAKCLDCMLYKTCQSPAIHGEGAEHPLIVFVGEAPGGYEDIKRRPFVGRAGQLLRDVIKEQGIYDQAFFTNICRCRPPENRKPTAQEMKTCGDQFFWQEIESHSPKIIVPLGATAASYIIGSKSSKITQARGKVYTVRDYICIPTFHPAYVLRKETEKPAWVGDIKNIVSIALGKREEKFHFHILDTEKDILRLFKLLKMKKLCSYDIETVGLNPYVETARVLSIAFSVSPTEHYFVHWDQLKNKRLLAGMKDILMDSEIKKIAQNGKYDNMYLRIREGIRVRGFFFDTMLAHYCLNEKRGTHSLDLLAWEHTSFGAYKEEMSSYKKDMSKAPLEKLAEYNCKDTAATFILYNVFRKELEEQGFKKLFYEIIMPASHWLEDLQISGVAIDVNYLKKIEPEYVEAMKSCEDQFKAIARKYGIVDINMNSAQQLKKLVFDKMKVKPLGETKSGAPSLDKEDLLSYEKRYRWAKVLSMHRKYFKIYSTYIRGFLDNVDNKGILRCEYLIHGTETGRLSSKNPVNLQNIPRTREDEDFSKFRFNPYLPIKRSMISRFEGGSVLEFDYSQIELRVLAMASKDPTMIDIFNSGGDIHQETAMWIFKSKHITPEQRNIAKRVNFGIVYGMGPSKLSLTVNISFEDAETYIRQWFRKYQGVQEWKQRTERFLIKNGYVETLFGRRRRFSEIFFTKDSKERQHILRQGINSPIQGTATDINLLAGIEVSRVLKKKKMQSRVISIVHDNLPTDAHPKEVEDCISLVKAVMTGMKFDFLNVPLVVDVKKGPNLADVTKIKD